MEAVSAPPAPWVTGTERLACVLRLAVGLLVLAMTLVYDEMASWLAVTAIVTAVGWSLLMAIALRSSLAPHQVARLAAGSQWFDVVLALVAYAVFLPDPEATPVAALPLLVYRLAVRYGRSGVVLGAATFAGLVGLRIAVNRASFGEGMIRPPLLLAWALVALLVLALAIEARARGVAPPVRTRLDDSGGSGASRDTAPSAGPAAAPVPVPGAPSTGDERIDSLAACLSLKLETHQAMASLTQRELEVLLLLGEGHTYAAVAGRLFISQSTVRNHVHNIRHKLEIEDRAEMQTLARALVARTSIPDSVEHRPEGAQDLLPGRSEPAV